MAERSTVRILLVDDDMETAQLIQQILRNNGFTALQHVKTAREGLAAAEECQIVLLDHRLPDINGLEVLQAIRSRATRPSVIVITAHGNESVAATALRRGADDYLVKDPSLAELLPQVLERVRRNRALRDALSAAERDLVRAERQAAIGEMTVTLHHQLNNPLAAACAEAELLGRADPGLTSEQQAAVQSIRAALDRIRDILRRASELRHAQSATYLPGIQMIDLDSSESAPASARGRALVCLINEDLARVAALLLRHAGFLVERCPSLELLEAAAQRSDVAMVLVGGASGPDDPALGGFTPSPERSYILVALVEGNVAAARAAGADHVVTLPFDPGTFTSDLLAVMKG